MRWVLHLIAEWFQLLLAAPSTAGPAELWSGGYGLVETAPDSPDTTNNQVSLGQILAMHLHQ